MFWNIGAHIAEKLKRSPLAARIVGGQLRKRQNVEYWRIAKDQDLLNGTMGALSWSYQHLDDEVRRCFAYCSVFPGRRPLRDELVRMWVAEGSIRNNNAGKELEDVGEEYFDELVSSSFLQLGVKGYHYHNYYVMHDLLHHLAERVTGNDCFRIESGWTGEVPRGVRHLFVEDLNGQMLIKRSVELENLQTLIINSIGVDTPPLDEEVLESMFRRLPKLRVLFIGFIRQAMLSVPTNIGLLKHLRLLAFRVGPSCRLILPSSFTKLYQIQTLDFGECYHLSFPSGEEIINLVSLRYARRIVDIGLVNISRSTSLRTVPSFALDQKHKLNRLRDLNKISGSLDISNLNHVESMEEALEAKLADKERLTELSLSWGGSGDKSSNTEVEAEVLEGLCPPMFLESLSIYHYDGARYPNWMVNKQSRGPKYLQKLTLCGCSRLGPEPELFEVFNNLRSFSLWRSSWDALPSSIQHLRFLKELNMNKCLNIGSLPALPQSLETFKLDRCDEVFMRSCQTKEDANWEKIQHIANRKFYPSDSRIPSKGVSLHENVSILEDAGECVPFNWWCICK